MYDFEKILRSPQQIELQLVRDRQEPREGTCGVRCGTYCERGSKREKTRDICYDQKKQLAAVKRGYRTRTLMVLPVAFWYPHVVCCLPSAIFVKKTEKILVKEHLCRRKCVRTGWYLNCYCYRGPYFPHRTTRGPRAAAQQKRAVWWGGKL